MIVLYTEAYSPYCAKVRKILAYKGLRYRTIPVPYHDKVRLIRDTRQDYVPFVRDGRTDVPWNRAVDYLERLRPKPTVYPNDTREQCKILEAWEYDWFEDRVWGLVAPFLEPTFEDPAERWNFVEYWERVYGPFDATRKDPSEAWASVEPSLRLLEDCLRARDFLLAELPTAFDFAIYGDFHAMRCAALRIPARYPKLRTWYRRLDRIGNRSL